MMTDVQILTVGIAVVVPVSTLIASYFLGSKLVDQISARIGTMETQLGKRIDDMRSDIRDLTTRIREIEKVR
jgi:hypothetical protein